MIFICNMSLVLEIKLPYLILSYKKNNLGDKVPPCPTPFYLGTLYEPHNTLILTVHVLVSFTSCNIFTHA